ncbi:MAG: hypothetical protein M0R30_05140 [Methanoregula sp.]|uniref:hypothetical protein n=1 Tax=Methanoregula sp. TaxID=2052170 RepID=UPI0025CDE16E|nr:hypothetical protein [Methanoregula sp.]MCK9631008.1 hypothetical protein [Methanoregula sp.]
MTNFCVRLQEQDDETLFTGKRLSLGPLTISTPCKLLDLNNSPTAFAFQALDQVHLATVAIAERSRFIHQETFIREADHSEARFLADSYDALKRPGILGNKLIVNSLTLTFNPFTIPTPEDYLRSILHIYHERSDLLLIPNLKVKRYNERMMPEFQVQEEEFTRYVDLAHEILRFRNSKPIFVPVPFKYGVRKFQSILSGYLGKGYRYFWLDFEGSSTTSKAAHVRAFHDSVDTEGLGEEVVLYGSNIRRENNPHLPDPRCPASDFLTAPLGVDIIGVNREPQRGGGDPGNRRPYVPPPPEESIPHKARLLDREDYTYVKYPAYSRSQELFGKYHVSEASIRDFPKFYSNFVNTFEINEELAQHQTIVRESGSLLEYLGTKPSINPKLMKAFEKIVHGDLGMQKTLDGFF